MTIKIGDQLHIVGTETIVIVLEPGDNREFTYLPGDSTKCVLFDHARMSEQEAVDLLKGLK